MFDEGFIKSSVDELTQNHFSNYGEDYQTFGTRIYIKSIERSLPSYTQSVGLVLYTTMGYLPYT